MDNKKNIDKVPKKAKLLIDNRIYEIDRIHFKTRQVTLKESEKAYNTVMIKYVEFVFDEFSEKEKQKFERKFLL